MKDILDKLGIKSENAGQSTGQESWEGSGALLESYSPVDGQLIASVREASREDYDRVVEKAQEAFREWRLVPAPKRGGMSSIIVRAALSDKPLISSDFGYMGTLVEKEKLGTTVDSESAEAICAAFQQALRGGVPYSPAALKKLAEQNTSEAFARQILEEITSWSTAPAP